MAESITIKVGKRFMRHSNGEILEVKEIEYGKNLFYHQWVLRVRLVSLSNSWDNWYVGKHLTDDIDAGLLVEL